MFLHLFFLNFDELEILILKSTNEFNLPLLGTLSDQRAHALINLSKKITDFAIDEESKMEHVSISHWHFCTSSAPKSITLSSDFKMQIWCLVQDDIDETEGVNVHFDDSDEEEKDENVMDELKSAFRLLLL